ncbi:MAG TPA: response regulator [Longimicrobiales bacterium]|nr:response regulator [Longimicrobiales bacterium]
MKAKSILVVEDNRDELAIYTTLLSYRGYRVFSASDFDGGLRTALEHRPDMAIVDVHLGDDSPDGCELVHALRRDDRTRSMPVIAHTAFGDVYHRSLAGLGCDQVIHKPADPTRLLHAVEQLIGPGCPEQQA